MHVWNVLHAARWKYRTQKIAKNRHLGTIAQLCRAISSQLRQISTIGKKLWSSNNVLHMSPQGELRPTSGWDRSGCLKHPCKFQRVSRLRSVTARHLVMVALYNRADHYIFAMWFLSSFFLLFFSPIISAVGDWMSTIFPHMLWP